MTWKKIIILFAIGLFILDLEQTFGLFEIGKRIKFLVWKSWNCH